MVKKHKLPCFAKLLFTLCSATFRYLGKVIRCLNLHALNQKMIMKNKEMQTRGTNLDINFLPTFNILSLVNLLKSKCNRIPRYFVNFKFKLYNTHGYIILNIYMLYNIHIVIWINYEYGILLITIQSHQDTENSQHPRRSPTYLFQIEQVILKAILTFLIFIVSQPVYDFMTHTMLFLDFMVILIILEYLIQHYGFTSIIWICFMLM